MSKHTPGPWAFDPGDEGDPSVGLGPTEPTIHVEHGDYEIDIATLYDPIYREDRDPIDEFDDCIASSGSLQANGALIAAAPDLLAACEAVLSILDGKTPREYQAYNAARLQLEAAIRKATEGDQQR